MDEQLLNYYERELTFTRQLGAEFARKYPKIAGRLLLEPDKCEDPHTERLIEAFAFLCGRVHKKIDDDFPEITESLLSIVYPHYVNPIPSMSVVKFEPMKKTVTAAGHLIEKNTALYSKAVDGNPCQFTTSYPVMLWPVEVVAAELREPRRAVEHAQQVIVVQLKTFSNLSVSQLGWKSLRFCLNGPHQHVFHLYELLLNHACHVELESFDKDGQIRVISLRPPAAIQPVGFEPQESMFPPSRRSFPGYLLLLEYFCFPEKFLFFDVFGLDETRKWDATDTLDICIYIDRAAKSNLVINRDTFCLNAAPAINLFKRIAEPIRVEQRKPEYRVIADVRRQGATEIFSIDRVTSTSLTSPDKVGDFKPFYSVRHHIEDEGVGQPFWHIQRRPSDKKDDDGTEVFLSFTDIALKPADPGAETLTIHTTCTNRNIPARLPFGDLTGDFHLEMAAPVVSISSLVKPTPTRRPTLGGALQWQLISHLSLNYLSLVEGGVDALREILTLYDFDKSPPNKQQISGIVGIQSRHVTKRVGQSFCRGVEVILEFDEDKYVGTGLYLFACILERFLGQYVTVNSFSQMVARTIQKKEPLRKWPPRNGNRILL